ncbi:MAG: glycoside hydrolase [Planctomycetota bacterium]
MSKRSAMVPKSVQALLLTTGLCCSQAGGQITPQPTQAGPAWRGWGTSIAWWSNPVADWSDAKFDELMDAVWDEDLGLGFNIARYNIGGGQNPAFPDSYMRAGGEMDGFQPVQGGPFDWTADAGQRRVLDAAIVRGVDVVEAFSNSPPYWLTISQDVSGNGTGNRDGTDNLDPANYLAFGIYLANVARHFRDEQNIHFESMIPLNEPTGVWWDGDGGQEGCVFRRSRQPDLFRATRQALDALGMTELPLSGPEEVSTGDTHDSFNSYPQDVRDMMSHVSTHSYGGGKRGQLNNLVKNARKPLWMSEYNNNGDDPLDSGLNLASRISLDITSMPHVSAWITWQVAEDLFLQHNWGQIRLPFSGAEAFFKRTQYHTTAQFSRWIRPGSRVLPSGRDNVVIAYDRARSRLTVVAVNDTNSPESLTLDLSAFDSLGSSASVIRTSASESQQELTDIVLVGSSLNIPLAARSVTTYVIDDVVASTLGTVTESDVSTFLTDLAADAPEADLDGDFKADAFDLIEMMHAAHIADAWQPIFAQSFSETEFANLEQYEIGNGDDGGYYLADDDVLWVQAFSPRPWTPENGGVAFRANGLTLLAGETYRFEFDAADFNQGWTTGGQLLIGIATSVPSATATPNIASAVVTVPEVNASEPSFQRYEISFVPTASAVSPLIVVRTSGIASGQQRIGVRNLTVTQRQLD